MPTHEQTGEDELRELSSGLDQLELELPSARGPLARVWSAAWPKVAGLAIALLVWQGVVWSGWRPEYLLPGPAKVFDKFFGEFGTLLDGTATTMQRAVVGFALALLIGTTIGALVVRLRVLRVAVGSLITGLQTMPSVAWIPLAIVLFRDNTEGAIMFVVVLGAAPSIANGLINGVDHIPPILLRTGRVLGARGLATLRHVIFPAALPSFVGGVKQGWAFAWRSLLAGELITVIAGKTSLGQQLVFNQDLSDTPGLVAVMTAILIVGIMVDSMLFGTVDRAIRRRYGLIDEATA